MIYMGEDGDEMKRVYICNVIADDFNAHKTIIQYHRQYINKKPSNK